MAVRTKGHTNPNRRVTCGMYMNITLHDYIRGITNVHHSTSTWTIEPRVDIPEGSLGQGSAAVERGVGNQVSSEFNLLYRFHSSISQRDDKWSQMFFKDVFGDKKPEDLSIPEFVAGALAHEAKIPKEPSERVFGGLKRDPKTGRFDDGALVQILRESIEDPAGKSFTSTVNARASSDFIISTGAFGARNVPKHMRTVEILGILQSRKW